MGKSIAIILSSLAENSSPEIKEKVKEILADIETGRLKIEIKEDSFSVETIISELQDWNPIRKSKCERPVKLLRYPKRSKKCLVEQL